MNLAVLSWTNSNGQQITAIEGPPRPPESNTKRLITKTNMTTGKTTEHHSNPGYLAAHKELIESLGNKITGWWPQ